MPDSDETLNDDQDQILDDGVENTDKVEDETDNEDDDKEEDDDSQDDDSKDSDDEEDEPEFTKAYSQLKGDTPEEYAKSLEEAYKNSSREGKLLSKQHKEDQARIDSIMAVVAKDPELAKKITAATDENSIPPTADPALIHARQQMEEQMDKDYAKFAEAHPEIDTDPALQEQVLEELRIFGDAARKNGKILSMEEGLRKAWISLGLDKGDSKERVVGKAKETASRSKTNNSSKKSGKTPTLTAEQITVGRKFGLTEKQMLASYGK